MTPAAKITLGGAGAVVALGVALYVARGPEPVTPPPRATASSASVPTATVGEIAPPPAASDTGTAVGARSAAPSTASAQPVEPRVAAFQMKRLASAREALAAGDAERALMDLHAYKTYPEPRVNKEEATLLEIQILPKVGRPTDALALARATRADPAFASYRGEIEAIALDAGLALPTR